MNMLVRFFILMMLLKHDLKRAPKQGSELTLKQLFTPFVRSYRILPHDMGFRNHLPNYRYLSFIELNITGWLTTCCQKKGHKPMFWIISMQEVVYLKEVKLFDKITVSSQLEGWDEKYIYFQHHFMVKNTIMAVGMTKFLLVDKKGKRPPQTLDMMDAHITPVIDSWNTHQQEVKSQG
ncbi:acyl-CoA thioesterase [Psychrobacter sp. I-STPA6b]|uniref:acyl-CoA thioesterase n=1 Tax=Psychrobacter sp. I-STPA6b TaxID=2585718 RepID=UPI001D0C315F|nr:acyl-CoA thioesterase [Psychrobacter sp. I-STPA6b]